MGYVKHCCKDSSPDNENRHFIAFILSKLCKFVLWNTKAFFFKNSQSCLPFIFTVFTFILICPSWANKSEWCLKLSTVILLNILFH